MSSEQPKPKKDKRFTESGKPLIYTESLMEIFGFDDNALRTNDNGFVTASQKQGINDEIKSEADAMWLLLTIFLGTAVLLAIIFSFQGYAPLPLVIGAGGLIGAMLAIAYFRQSRLQQDSERLRSYRVDGVPQIRATLSGDKQVIMQINDQKLPISYQQAAALSEFELPMMRVYYAQHSKQVLSAEVLVNDNFDKLKNEDLADDEQAAIYAARQLDDEQSMMQR